ncbi:MAG: cytochrome-c peroxidase [Helicobacteraceae bacterium]|jgi:cytochrome c peroxidase|nr:cytochrome-c peroxidase [Helicobacteraceae bacterium]
MTKKRRISWIVFFISVVFIMGNAIYVIYFSEKEEAPAGSLLLERDVSVGARTLKRENEPISPIRKPKNLNAGKVELGYALFHDPRLSKDDTISCASCHDLLNGGVDDTKFSVGVDGAVGSINAITVYNSSLNFVQFWDGRAKSLAEQTAGPITNPVEMASSWQQVISKLSADADLSDYFIRVYGEKPGRRNIADALAEFERSLVTPSRLDRWLQGDNDALTPAELRGYNAFVSHGCAACHQGEGIGGNIYQRFGIMHDYFANKGQISQSDMGRFNVTKREEDRFVFKVPSLRNVMLTAPYFHDGSSETLESAVVQMGYFQLGENLPSGDVENIVEFLNALTGEELQR